MQINLDTPITELPMVGPTYGKRLGKLRIQTIYDLIHHYPSRYNDYSLITLINNVQPGEIVTIQGAVESITNEYTKYGKKIQKALVSDNSGKIEVVWFNQPFLVQTLKKGSRISLSGKVSFFGRSITLQSPEYELAKQGTLRVGGQATIHTGRLVPVYPETAGVSSKWLRRQIKNALMSVNDQLTEFLPNKIITSQKLIEYREALCAIHFPKTLEESRKARERLAFDELFLVQLASSIRARSWKKEITGKRLCVDKFKTKINIMINNLPFKLTNAQNRCINQILADLDQEKPMNRLLQGDTGSGKTVVASIAMYVCCLNGFRSAFMAPTEILALQHYETIHALLEPLGITVGILTGSTKSNNAKESDVLIGTHALIHTEHIEKLALVVIDEQHRFGVKQRTALSRKGLHPHLLAMTATPIPRSVALVLHAELDLSYIDQMPIGRKSVKTWLVPNKKRRNAYEWIKEQIKASASGQAFIVCPLIEESEHETMQSVKAASSEYERLRKYVFPSLRIGLIHGRMKGKKKDTVLKKFASGEIDILVATPVVEVGIDIPCATIMVIEAAERFGLAQIHQLRGRVGRSDAQSYCLLFTETESASAIRRLKNLERVHSGAELSEIDMKTRGCGDLFGTRQHGFSDFKLASFSDTALMAKTKRAVDYIFSQDPDFGYPNNKTSCFPALRKKLEKDIMQEIDPN